MRKAALLMFVVALLLLPMNGQAPGVGGYPASVNTEGIKPTYSFAVTAITPVATPTDWITVCGSATKTIRITRIEIDGLATTAGDMDVVLIQRTAANSGGTTSAVTPGAHDSQSAAATATISRYTANAASLGAGNAVRSQKISFNLAGASQDILIWDFTTRNTQALVERGAAQCAAINLNGDAVPAGTAINASGEFTEE